MSFLEKKKTTKTILKSLLASSIPLDPAHYLLGSPIPNSTKIATKLMNVIVSAARCLVALKWKKTSPPFRENL